MRLFISLAAMALFGAVVLTACNANDGSSAAGTRVASGGNANTSNQSAGVTGAAPTVSQPVATPQSQEGNTHADGVRRMTPAELRAALNKGTAVVVDVRSRESYRQEHIKGSKNIPEAEIASHVNDLPRDKTIVTYCS